jgi:hypothetical protein
MGAGISWPVIAKAVPTFAAGAVVSAVLLIVLVVALVVVAERSLKRHRGHGLKRDRSERNAMSRMVAGLARWGGGGGGGGS